ncbi:MAG: MBL fold metallo-hydrolase [Thermoplasmata archaeon]|nr:MBL fold metallo-hydrolase [Thermoplasmata archaeon]
MWIRWHGHSCFELRDSTTVITDPHDGKSIGILVPNLKGDIVLISHDHFDHNCARMVKGPDVSVIRDPVMTVEKGVRIQGFETYHDTDSGSKRGKNTVWRLEMDSMSFCHLGDLGHMLSDDLVQQIAPVDVLFIPVGNIFTLDIQSAKKLTSAIDPRIVVPMHYRIGGLSLSIRPVNDFLSGFPEQKVAKVGNEVEIKREDLPSDQEVWVFSM